MCGGIAEGRPLAEVIAREDTPCRCRPPSSTRRKSISASPGPQEMGKAVLSQGRHEHCGREACRGHRRDRHHGVQSWRASARRVEERQNRCDLRRRHHPWHRLESSFLGAKACSGGRLYLYALAAAGQAGVERALENLRAEIERDMKLMGCRSVTTTRRTRNGYGCSQTTT
jgi:FMN-dependent dehydrogenase